MTGCARAPRRGAPGPSHVSMTPAPVAGYPVVVFGHGVTRSRMDVLAIANTLTATGFAVIAADHDTFAARADDIELSLLHRGSSQ